MRNIWEMTQKEYLAQESEAREFGTSLRVVSEIGRDHAKAVYDAVCYGEEVAQSVLVDYPNVKHLYDAYEKERVALRKDIADLSPLLKEGWSLRLNPATRKISAWHGFMSFRKSYSSVVEAVKDTWRHSTDGYRSRFDQKIPKHVADGIKVYTKGKIQ